MEESVKTWTETERQNFLDHVARAYSGCYSCYHRGGGATLDLLQAGYYALKYMGMETPVYDSSALRAFFTAFMGGLLLQDTSWRYVSEKAAAIQAAVIERPVAALRAIKKKAAEDALEKAQADYAAYEKGAI